MTALRRLAPYATHAAASRGRLYAEPESQSRSVFQRDRDRIIHSTAFRRLQHKTQVFVYDEGDHYRTRLTHSLEVAQIARSIARSLGLDDDLAEALALAHDLGHTPFGHAGEEALDACMREHGGFDHNAQALRIVTMLERHYAEFDGLNLTWETLEGLVKHNGPLRGPDVPETILAYTARHDLELGTFAGLEAQVAAWADDIAYNNHDIDDGLRAELFGVADLADVPLVGPVFHAVARKYPGIERPRLIHESIRRLINLMVTDLLTQTRARLAASTPASTEEVRAQPRPMVAFSAEMEAHNQALKSFLFKRMYRHARVNQMTDHARKVVRDLFLVYMGNPPPAVVRQEAPRARAVADYIAGMTDRFALDEHNRLCAPENNK